jgi:hypothetical protein
MPPFPMIENECILFVLLDQIPLRVYTGLEGRVRKSEDAYGDVL